MISNAYCVVFSSFCVPCVASLFGLPDITLCTICSKCCQCFVAGLWLSLSTLVYSMNKTYSHNIIEILLKVALIQNVISVIYTGAMRLYCSCRYIYLNLTCGEMHMIQTLCTHFELSGVKNKVQLFQTDKMLNSSFPRKQVIMQLHENEVSLYLLY